MSDLVDLQVRNEFSCAHERCNPYCSLLSIVDQTVIGQTIPGGRDYGPFPESMVNLAVVLLPNETQLNFGVLIREDAIVENMESFAARIEIPPDAVPGNIMEANVFILDNDSKCCFLWKGLVPVVTAMTS